MREVEVNRTDYSSPFEQCGRRCSDFLAKEEVAGPRFSVICQIGNLDGKSILDVGYG